MAENDVLPLLLFVVINLFSPDVRRRSGAVLARVVADVREFGEINADEESAVDIAIMNEKKTFIVSTTFSYNSTVKREVLFQESVAIGQLW